MMYRAPPSGNLPLIGRTSRRLRMAETRDRRLVLGFDGGCFTCTDLAQRIEERLEGKIEVKSLHDPQVAGWREQALGENATWAPTLFEIYGVKVRAWTGWKMGARMVRYLGLAATWWVMQEIGEVTQLEKPTPDPASSAVGMSRAQFLKGVGGAVFAMSLLSGTNLVADSANATSDNPYRIVKTRKVTGDRLKELARQRATNRDVKNLAGEALSTAAKINNANPQGYVHTLKNGTVASVVVYVLSGKRLLAHFRFSKPVPEHRGAASIARLWEPDGKRHVAVKVSENGNLWRRPQTRSAQSGTTPLRDCPPVNGGGNTSPPKCAEYRSYECLKWEVSSTSPQ
jgi:hypothetical protein